MNQVIILKGLVASGKTTWAMEYLRAHPDKVRRVNKDEIRRMLYGKNGKFDDEKIVIAIRDFTIEKILSEHFDVIVDDTNLKDKHFYAICDCARRVGNVRVWEKFFYVDLKVALARNKARPNPIPDSEIQQMFETNLNGKPPETRDLYFGLKGSYYIDKERLVLGAGKAIIVDIDGTLALNLSGRDYYDMSRIDEDTLNVVVADLIRLYKSAGRAVLLVSGREGDEYTRPKTIEWLEKYNVPYDALYMREIGDSRGDVITKQELYDTFIKGNYNVEFCVDDRKKVCRMWRLLGIPCLQLDVGALRCQNEIAALFGA